MGRHKRREDLGELDIKLFVENATRFHGILMDFNSKLSPRGEHYRLTSAVADQLRAGIEGLTGKQVPWSLPNGTPDPYGFRRDPE